MAINHYRALVRENGAIQNSEGDLEEQARQLLFAIGNAPAFAHLDYEAYVHIKAWCDRVQEVAADEWSVRPYLLREQFELMLLAILPAMGQEWLDLGMPTTAEEWGRIKYGGE